MFAEDPHPENPTVPNGSDNVVREAPFNCEQAFRILLEYCPDIVVRLDRNLRFTFVSPSIERSLGIPASKLLGRTPAEAGMPPQTYEKFQTYAQIVFRTAIARPIEFSMTGPRQTASYEARLAPEFAPNGTVAAVICVARDITRRALAEEALRDSEQRFRLVLANSPVTVLTCDRELRYTWIYNPFPLFRAEDISGKRDDELAPAADVRELMLLKHSVLESGTGRRAEIRVRVNDDIRWYDATAEPMRDQDGNVTGVRAAATDITDRKRAEEKLRESEERYRVLAEASPNMIWTMRPDGTPEFVNRKWTEFTGLTLRRTMRVGFAALVHPEDRSRTMACINTALLHGEPCQIEFRLRRRKDRAWLWMFGWGIPIRDATGSVVKWFATIMDIDARKRAEAERERLVEDYRRQRDISERLAGEAEQRAKEAATYSERFRRLLEGGIIGIAVANETRITEANDTFLALSGYSRRDLEEGSIDRRSLTAPEYADRDKQAWRELTESGAFKPFEKEFVRKDGSRVPVLVGGSILQPPPNVEVVKFVLDLTDRKQAEEQLRRAQRIESIGVLAGGIAHDFNNLLTGILGNASLILDAIAPDDPNRRFLNAIVRQSEKAAELTRQLLAYSGKGRFVTVPTDLSATVSGVMHLLRPSIPPRVEVQQDLAPDLPKVNADPGQMEQVVTNLVLNAAEALGDKGGRILIRTHAAGVDDAFLNQAKLTIPSGTYVLLEVHDTGHGIPAETRGKIFEPFFTTRFAGRGLGLAAVQGIVEGHRGAIQVYSEPGRGSRFIVMIPAAEPVWQPAIAPPETGEPLPGGQTIVIVDDDDAVLSAAKGSLEPRGYEVLTATSGAEALDVFQSRAAEINGVVLDLTMAGMAAEEIISRLKAIRPDIPVLISSDYSQADLSKRFAGVDIAGFLAKPYGAVELAARVRSTFRGKTSGAGDYPEGKQNPLS